VAQCGGAGGGGAGEDVAAYDAIWDGIEGVLGDRIWCRLCWRWLLLLLVGGFDVVAPSETNERTTLLAPDYLCCCKMVC